MEQTRRRREATIELYELVRAFSRRYCLNIYRGSKYNREEAGFEDVICEFVDAIEITRKIKNASKRAVIIQKMLGYCDWEIALNMGLSERTVRRYTNWLKDFIRKVS